MANMSYCRFHNTRIDMNDCLEALRDAEWCGEKISKSELECCGRMFDNIIKYFEEEGLLENFDYDVYDEWKDHLKNDLCGEEWD